VWYNKVHVAMLRSQNWVFIFSLSLILLFIVLPVSLSPGTALSPRYQIKFSPTVGDSFRYMLHTSIQAEGKDLLGKEVSLKADASGELAFAIKRNLPDNVSTAVTVPGILVTTDSLGESETYTIRTRDKQAVRAAFDHTGAVIQVHNLEALTRRGIWNISFGTILQNHLPTLPKSAVSPGDKWSDSRTLTIPFQEIELEVLINRTYFLESILPTESGEMASVSIQYQVALSGEKKLAGLTGSLEGKGSGAGSMLYHMGKSCIKEFSADYKTEASLVVKRENKIFLEQPFNLTVSASLYLMN